MKGHWPKRDDFDVEWADNSEMLIAAMTFDGQSEPLNPSAVSRATEEAEAFFRRATDESYPLASLEADVAAAAKADADAEAVSSAAAIAAKDGEGAAANGEANAAAAAAEEEEEEEEEPSPETLSGRLVIKLEVLQLYNQRLDGRVRRKKFVRDHSLLDYPQQHRLEQQLPPDEKAIMLAIRPFAQHHTPEE